MKKLIMHIRPIRRSHGLDFIAGMDTVMSSNDISSDELVHIDQWFESDFQERTLVTANLEYSQEEVSNSIIAESLVNGIGERTHIKFYRITNQ